MGRKGPKGMMRHLLKRSVEVGLVRSGLSGLWRKRVSGRGLVLAYHNIVPDDFEGTGDPSLHLARGEFVRQMEILGRTHEIVPLEQWLGSVGERRERGGGDRPVAAITFDDAYRGALALGGEVLDEHGLPATFFVSPGRLGSEPYWWDALADPVTGLDEAVRARALNHGRGCQEDAFALASDCGIEPRELPSVQRPGSLEQLDALASGSEGITVASHGWEHCNLVQLGDSELEAELVRPMRWLENRDWDARPWLAYPYGSCSPRVEDAARRTGYQACFRVTGGWYSPGTGRPTSLPRLNVPAGLSPEGFELRLSDIL